MLSPDKTYHTISELANRRVALFHLLNECWDAKKHWTNGHIVCLMLWFVCFSLLATVYIDYILSWSNHGSQREREGGQNRFNKPHTHTWLANLVYMDMFGQVCLWQPIYGKFWTTWNLELTHSHEIQQVKYCCLEHGVIAKEIAGLNFCLSTSKAKSTEQARRCGNCIVSERTYLHVVLACDRIWRTVRCGTFRNIARSKFVLNSFVYIV